ncbi:MAG: class I adenylate-forming enzyme family protein [Acidimicrobiales bacterium]
MSAAFNLADQLAIVTKHYPDNLAVACGDYRCPFETFYDKVRRIASGLGELGVTRESRILALAANCHRFIELYWAAILLGAAVVPVEGRLTDEEISYLDTSTQPALVVADSLACAERLEHIVDTDHKVICFEESNGRFSLFDDLMQASLMDLPDGTVSPQTPALIMYTAAVEGRPKGAVITHANLLAQAEQTRRAVDLGPDSRHGVFLPLTHTFGAYLMFVATCAGATNTVIGAFDADNAVKAIGQGLVSFFATFAPMGERIQLAADQNRVDLGDRLDFATGLEVATTIDRYRSAGVRYYYMYGQTEAAGMVAMGLAPTDGAIAPNYSGVMLSGTRLSLRDHENQEVEPGQAGEAWLRGDCIVERYWPDQPTRLSESGWLRTGDILREERDGRLYFVARTSDKDLIKPGGLNVYPAEVEHVLRQHPEVQAAFVFGDDDPLWREQVCAVVTTSMREHATTLETELRELCSSKLASYKRPVRIALHSGASSGPAPQSRSEAKEYFLKLHDTLREVEH